MREVVGRITRQADPLHHRSRPAVPNGRDRHDLVEAMDAEAPPERCPGRLGRKTMAPREPGEPPADLGLRQVRQPGQAREAEECAILGPLDRPQAVSVSEPAAEDPVDQRVALGPGQGRREVLHHGRIGVQCRERLSVRVTECAEEQPVGDELGDGGDGPRTRRLRHRASKDRFDSP